MKPTRKSSSPYFKKRDSFESPECSTVVQVNPSCESEESMLQKIIFPDQMTSKNNYHDNKYQRGALQQKSLNTMEVNRNFGKVNKNYKYIHENVQPKEVQVEYNYQKPKQNQNACQHISNRYISYRSSKEKYDIQNNDKSPRQRLNSLSSTNSVRNLMERTNSNLGLRLQSYQSNELNKNYSTQKNNYGNENDSGAFIDEIKLREIQEKIKRYQQKNRQQAYGSNQIHRQTAKKANFRDTMETHLNNIQIDFVSAPQNKLKKKMTIIDNISFEKENRPSKVSPTDQPKMNLKEKIKRQKSQAKLFDQSQRSKINSEQKRVLERCLEKIYSLILIDNQFGLSSQNINLKTLSIEEVKLILGPIFTQVKIRNKTYSKQLFIEKAIDIFNSFKNEQIQRIVKLFAQETGYQQNQILSQTSSSAQTRVPGRLLSQSKVGLKKEPQIIESKRSQSTYKESLNPSKNFRDYSDLNNLIEIPALHIPQNYQKSRPQSKVTKNVYMEPTQKTEGDEAYFPRYRQRYETQIDMNEKALEMMLAEQRSKKFVSTNRGKESREALEDDEQLQRLKQLERKFNEHFSSRK